MEHTLTASDLARRLSEVLSRVRDHGERFAVERNGEPVAALIPVDAAPRVTVGELFERLRAIGLPDEDFAADLEAIQATQPKLASPKWPS